MPEAWAAFSYPRTLRNQTKTSPCLEPNQGPLGSKTSSKLLSVAPKALRSSPTLAALSRAPTRLPDGAFCNTHQGIPASSTLHTLFPPFLVQLSLALDRPCLPAFLTPLVFLHDICLFWPSRGTQQVAQNFQGPILLMNAHEPPAHTGTLRDPGIPFPERVGKRPSLWGYKVQPDRNRKILWKLEARAGAGCSLFGSPPAKDRLRPARPLPAGTRAHCAFYGSSLALPSWGSLRSQPPGSLDPATLCPRV